MQPVDYIDSLGRRIVLVDSPGFDDTYLSDLDILKLIANWLKQTWVFKYLHLHLFNFIPPSSYQGGKVLSGLLYLHRISDNRMGNSPLRLLEMFKNICGEDAFQNVILVTTMWDEVTPEQGTLREQELQCAFWKDMLALGARMERSYNTKESAEQIVSKFRPETGRPLLMQTEMVVERKPLSETTAGRPFFSWLVDFINFIEGAIKALQRKLRWAKKRKRSALKEDIRQKQIFIGAANVHLGSYNSLPIPGTQRPSYPRLNLSCPELNVAWSTSSDPASFTSTTASSPSDVFLSQNIDLRALRTRYVTALKNIRQLLGAFPISGLINLVEMVIKIGEMIEVQSHTPFLTVHQVLSCRVLANRDPGRCCSVIPTPGYLQCDVQHY